MVIQPNFCSSLLLRARYACGWACLAAGVVWATGGGALPARAGTAVQFDGSNDYITFGTALGLSVSNVTAEVWFKRTGAGAATGTGGGGVTDAIPLISKGRGEADGDNRDMNYILAIRASDSRLVADFEAGPGSSSLGQNYPVAGITVLLNNVWYHAAATYDGATWRLYLNGVLETTLFVGQRLRLDSIQHAALASALDSSGAAAGFFSGVLDEARIWNYARSPGEIAENYQRQIVSAPGLVGRWSLDEGVGTTAANSGSSGINGTLLNGPAWVAGYNFETSPSVTLTNPVSGAEFIAPTNVTLEASASDLDGTVTNVAFFTNGVVLASVTNAPFSFIWTNPPLGFHALRAVATDHTGLAATSSVVSLAVHDSIVRLTSPTNGSLSTIPQPVSLIAAVNETNGPVTSVEFFAGTNSLGTNISAPWAMTWSNAPPGSYSLTAVAVDAGGSHTSAPVALVVASNSAPAISLTAPLHNSTVSSPTNVLITAGATDSDGTVTQVVFFVNGAPLATDTSAPFSTTWTNPPVGSHTLTASATDHHGATNLSVASTLNVANAKVTRGPYLQSPASTSGLVCWRTDVFTAGRVRYGTDATALTNFSDELAFTNDHFVLLADLQPETRYYYSVGTTNVTLAVSTNYFLSTTPLPGTNRPVRVWVLGDPGMRDANQTAVRNAYYNFTTNTPRSDLILLLGDNAYNNGTDVEYQGAIFDMYTNVLGNTPLWPAIGNHDTAGSANPTLTIPYFKMFALPAAGESGGVPSGTEKYYSFDFANVHFVCLDSMTSARTTNGPMATWLREDLSSTTQQWVVAFYHHPAYSRGGHNSDSVVELVEMRQRFVPIFEEYGVDLTLVGHSHNYERSMLINGHYGLANTFTDTMKIDAGNGRTNGTGAYLKPGTLGADQGSIHCTAGTSGRTEGGTLNHPVMFMSVNTLGSVVLDIEGERLDFKFLTSLGVIQDHFTILKGPQAAPPLAPTNLTAALVSSTQARLTWPNTPTNELGFEIERSLDGMAFTPLTTLGANLTNYTNGGLALVTTYYFRVRATNSAGASAWSPVAFVGTAPNQPPVVSITAPANNTNLVSGVNLVVNATATDPDGSVTQVVFFVDGARVATDLAAPYSFTWSNAPLGTATFTARATDNSGAISTSAPVVVTVTNSPSGTNTLIAQGANWRYLDNGSDQGTAWRTTAFADSNWADGPAQLGYGDGDEATVVGYGPDANNRYLTTYFRRAWMVSDPSAFSRLLLSVIRDDGAVVYLNGTEIFRSANMPSGSILFNTLSGSANDNTLDTASLASAGSLLVTGTNVIAVEIHQSAANSSDISFDLQLMALPPAVPMPPVIARGPYLQSGTTNSVIVRWRTDTATNSVVRFGTNAAELNFAVTNQPATTEHVVALTNLPADTKFFYALAAGTNTLASGTNYFFTTAPPIGLDKPVRLWVVGDSGTANANARAVRDYYLNYAANQPADLFLMLGDNAYNTGTDQEYQAAVFDMYPTVLRNTVVWPTIGNHDTAHSTTPPATLPYFNIFSLPQNGEAGGVASGTEKYYSFDYANIHFVCLDSMSSSRATNGAMADWLRADLAAHTQEWLVAFWHHPPYTKGSHNSDSETELIEMRQRFLPILEEHGVDLVLAGHSHSYERSFLLQGHYGLSGTLNNAMKLDAGDGRESGTGAYVKTSGDGAAYIVAGSSGQISGGSLNHAAMFLSLNELGSVVIDVSSNRMDVKMLGTAAVRDTFTIRKQPAPAPQFDRFANQGFKARTAQFLTPDWFALTNVATTSSATGTVSRLGDWVLYTPPVGLTNLDTFNYTVVDQRGTNLTALATTVVVSNHAATPNVLVEDLGNGSVRVRFSGIPGRTYSMQFSNDVNAPSWQTAAMATANGRGEFEFVDTPPPQAARLYRSATP